MSMDELIREWPELEKEDILASLDYAAKKRRKKYLCNNKLIHTLDESVNTIFKSTPKTPII